jgi:SMODS-associated and fused to various effectors sensor domain
MSSVARPGASAAAAAVASTLPVCDDAAFAGAMHLAYSRSQQLLVVVNAFTACLYRRAAAADSWEAVCRGEFDEEACQAAVDHKALTWWLQVSGSPWSCDLAGETPKRVTKVAMESWLGVASKLTHREGEVTQAIKDELTYLAGWRCQFAGCGLDLRHHPATGRRGRFSYFAHIVAASKDGPRGDEDLSPKLASDPENFLLLCDGCHRLIDKRDPGFYTVEMLRKMRAESVAAVQALLGTLRYPDALPVAVIGNIAGQQGQLRYEDAMAAMWAARLRSPTTQIEHFLRLGGSLHTVHEPGYWSSLFLNLRHEIPRLQGILNGTVTGGGLRPRLAVFPLHGTSVLVLTGRLLGDNDATQVFQPRRDNVSNQTRWQWPAANEVSTPAPQFQLSQLHPWEPTSTEATLLVYLTANIDPNRLPQSVHGANGWRLPTLKLSIDSPNADCIERPEDLRALGRSIDDAIRRLQDEWHVERVHLIVCAPTSVCVTLGQKLQARHHAKYMCYEALTGPGAPYKATIEISSESVCELVSGTDASASLQL